jgi:DNA-binding NarL/FixJ family response regulator
VSSYTNGTGSSTRTGFGLGRTNGQTPANPSAAAYADHASGAHGPHARPLPGGSAAAVGPARLTVLLADDHHLFREGLRQILESTGEIEVVAEAANGEEAIRLAREFQPRVILMDINMPVVDGIRATEAVTRTCPQTNVIVLTMFWEDDYAIQAVRAGAKGYLLKNARSEDVVRAVRLAANGGSAIDPSLAPVLLKEYHRMLTRSPEDASRDGALTQRDITLLRLLAAGNNNKQIATELNLAESTVKNNLSALFHKIDVRDRTQAVLYAFAEGLVPRPVAN